MKQYIETYKRLYFSESITEEQRNQVVLSIDRLFKAGKITETEKQYIFGEEE